MYNGIVAIGAIDTRANFQSRIMPTIYMDACCLSRPFDDQSQARIRLETEAVLTVFARVQTGDWIWVRSSVLDAEMDRTPDPELRARIRLFDSYPHRAVRPDLKPEERARELHGLGIQAFDALHLACAEGSGADVFLTTDDRLLHQALRLTDQLRVRVANPLAWIEEVTK